jgi:hypothetical protein
LVAAGGSTSDVSIPPFATSGTASASAVEDSVERAGITVLIQKWVGAFLEVGITA